MQAQGNSNSRSRWFQRGLIAVVVVGLLIGAAFVWGNSLRADTQQSAVQSAAHYGSLNGVSAVRAADAAAATGTALGTQWLCSGGTGSTCFEVPAADPEVRWLCSGGTGSTCVEVTAH